MDERDAIESKNGGLSGYETSEDVDGGQEEEEEEQEEEEEEEQEEEQQEEQEQEEEEEEQEQEEQEEEEQEQEQGDEQGKEEAEAEGDEQQGAEQEPAVTPRNAGGVRKGAPKRLQGATPKTAFTKRQQQQQRTTPAPKAAAAKSAAAGKVTKKAGVSKYGMSSRGLRMFEKVSLARRIFFSSSVFLLSHTTTLLSLLHCRMRTPTSTASWTPAWSTRTPSSQT